MPINPLKDLFGWPMKDGTVRSPAEASCFLTAGQIISAEVTHPESGEKIRAKIAGKYIDKPGKYTFFFPRPDSLYVRRPDGSLLKFKPRKK